MSVLTIALWLSLPARAGTLTPPSGSGTKTGLEVKSAAGPLATPETEARRKGALTDLAAPVGRLFDLPAWRRGDGESFERERKRLQRRLVAPGLILKEVARRPGDHLVP